MESCCHPADLLGGNIRLFGEDPAELGLKCHRCTGPPAMKQDIHKQVHSEENVNSTWLAETGVNKGRFEMCSKTGY